MPMLSQVQYLILEQLSLGQHGIYVDKNVSSATRKAVAVVSVCQQVTIVTLKLGRVLFRVMSQVQRLP